MKRFISVTFALIMMLGCFASCSGKKDYDTISTTDPYQIRTNIGQQALPRKFVLEIYNEEGELSAYNVYTEKLTLGDALDQYMMGKFEKDAQTGENTISLTDFPLKKGCEWAVYVKGIRTQLPPNNIVIVNDSTYTFAQVPEGK